MKVTLLIAVCTLVVLLHQMQTPMAKPQFSEVNPPPTFDTICESILVYISKLSVYAYRHEIMNFFPPCNILMGVKMTNDKRPYWVVY